MPFPFHVGHPLDSFLLPGASMRPAVIALLFAFPAMAQVQQLWESPAASVSQNLGLTRIDLSYHRPAVKGRVIWGHLVPFGQVWRAGANDATTLTFSTDVRVAGKPVSKGAYALFILPQKDRWTVILNKDPKQWGAYSHKPERDELRFEVTPELAVHQERLVYSIDLKDRDTALVGLHWEKLRISFPITADVETIYQTYLQEEVAKAEVNPDKKAAWAAYFLAAKYHINGGRLTEAEPLLAKATALNENFWAVEWKARLLKKQGKVKEALPLLDRAQELAAGKAPREYIQGLDTLKSEWNKAK